MNAPLGHTGTRSPLIVRPAVPLPTDPNTKFESRELMSAPWGGYTTFISSGPSISGTAGSLAFGAGTGARATSVEAALNGGVRTGVDAVCGAPEAQAVATTATGSDRRRLVRTIAQS